METKDNMKQSFEKIIRKVGPLRAIRFAADRDFDFDRFYADCPIGEWMLPLLDKFGILDHKIIVSLACKCVRRIIGFARDPRDVNTLIDTERWVKGITEMPDDDTYVSLASWLPIPVVDGVPLKDAVPSTATKEAVEALYRRNTSEALYCAAIAATAYTPGHFMKERQWQADLIRNHLNPIKAFVSNC